MSAAQPPRDRDDWIQCPLIVLAPDVSKILVSRGKAGLCLPSVGIRAHLRLAASLTSATEEFLGVRTVHCFSLPSLSRRAAYRVMECIADERGSSAAFEWKAVRELTADCFTDQTDFEAVLKTLSRTRDTTVPAPEPFSRLGWFAEVRQWVNESVERCGLHLTGDFQQWNAAPGFSLIRFATDDRAVWFKAAGKQLARELEITRGLCGLFPDYTVRLVALNPKWNAWLAAEAEGCAMDEVTCPEAWQYVAGRLADLQIASIGHAQAILRSGATECSTPLLLQRIPEFIEEARALMAQQQKPSSAALTDDQLDELRDAIERSVCEADELGAPAALGNIDFNPGNVVVNRVASCTFLDWAGAYVGYPFATFEYLLEHLRRMPNASDGRLERLQHAYWRRWGARLDQAQMAALRRITPLLSVFLFADHMRRERGNVNDASSAGYMRSLLRRMKRESDLMAAPPASAPAPA